MRVRRQLVDQHRQWLLRRSAVQPQHLARVRRQRLPAPGEPRRADSDSQEAPGRRGLGCMAGVLIEAGFALARWRAGCSIPRHTRAGEPVGAAAEQAARAELRHRRQHHTKDRCYSVKPRTTSSSRPGLGSLTLGLLQAARRVIAIEIDDLLAAQLPRTVAARLPERAAALTVINADALRSTPCPKRRQPSLPTFRTTSQCRCCCTCWQRSTVGAAVW